MAYDPPTNDVRERLQEIARTLEAMLPPYTGFAMLCFDFNLKPGQGRLEYVSNANRDDIVKGMKEWIAKSETSFGTHSDTGLGTHSDTGPATTHPQPRCTHITNLMARLATDNSEAAHVALKAQVVCVMCDLMEDHGIPFNRATAEVLEDLARNIREKTP